MDRRQMLQTGLVTLVGAAARPADVRAQGGTPTSSKALGVHPLGTGFGDWQGNMLEVTYQPGAVSASHQHPGPTFGYVVKGRIQWAINGEPAKVLEAGQTFFEPMGSVHSTSANASATEPAVIAVVLLSKPGEALSKPATAKPSAAE